MSEQYTIDPADLPDTVFSDMTDEQIGQALIAIEQTNNALYLSGDPTARANAMAMGTIAHAIRHLFDEVAAPPASRSAYRGADADDGGKGADDGKGKAAGGHDDDGKGKAAGGHDAKAK